MEEIKKRKTNVKLIGTSTYSWSVLKALSTEESISMSKLLDEAVLLLLEKRKAAEVGDVE